MNRIIRAVRHFSAAGLILAGIVACGGGGGDTGKGTLDVSPSTLNFEVVEGSPSTSQIAALKLPSGSDFVGLTKGSAKPAWVGFAFQNGAMRITVLPFRLVPGTYSVTLDLCATDPFGDCVDTAPLNVNLVVREAPIVTPASYSMKRTAIADLPVNFDVPLDARHASWTITSDAPWVTPVLATVANARSVRFAVDSRSLAPGRHTARVQMASSAGAQQVLSVELDLAAWAISVAPLPSNLSTIAGKPSGSITSVAISHNANDSHAITVTPQQDWLKVSMINYGNTAAMSIHAEPSAAMTPGNYIGQIAVKAGQGATSLTTTVDVPLVLSALNFAASIARIDATLVAGAPSLPTRIEQISNLGGKVAWTGTADRDWIKITRNYFGDLQVVLDPPLSLAAGAHSGTITIIADIGGTPRTLQVAVGLTVITPTYAPSLTSISSTRMIGTGHQEFIASLTNLPATGATLTYTSSVPWITFRAGTHRLDTPTAVSLQSSLLQSGTYTGTITATATYGSFTATSIIPVTQTLTPASLDILSLRNSTGTGGSMPTIQLKASLSPDLPSTTARWSTTTPWLLLPTSSETGVTILASMNAAAGLTAGTHRANVTAVAQVDGDVLTTTFTFDLVLQ